MLFRDTDILRKLEQRLGPITPDSDWESRPITKRKSLARGLSSFIWKFVFGAGYHSKRAKAHGSLLGVLDGMQTALLSSETS